MFLVLFNPCTQCILPCKKWRHWWNNLAGEGLWRVRGAAQVPNGTVGTRAGPHKTFQRATFQIGALWSIFYPIHKIFGVWLDFVPQVKCQKGRVFFPFLRERSPLKMERKKYDICYKALDPRPKMALFFPDICWLYFFPLKLNLICMKRILHLVPIKRYHLIIGSKWTFENQRVWKDWRVWSSPIWLLKGLQVSNFPSQLNRRGYIVTRQHWAFNENEKCNFGTFPIQTSMKLWECFCSFSLFLCFTILTTNLP